MKLISKFHDFYDSCLSLGIDETIFFKRETQEIKKEEKITRFYKRDEFYIITYPSWNVNFGEYQIEDVFLLHFCGKEIPIIKIKVKIQENYFTREFVSYCYNIKQIEAFIVKYCNKEVIENFYKKPRQKNRQSKYNEISTWFFEYSNRKTQFDEYFNYQVPYYLVTSKQIILNPCLSDYEFYRYSGAFDTFQEISMFISGIMGGQVPKMIEISDKVRMEKKGFDSVTSFRKMERK